MARFDLRVTFNLKDSLVFLQTELWKRSDQCADLTFMSGRISCCAYFNFSVRVHRYLYVYEVKRSRQKLDALVTFLKVTLL